MAEPATVPAARCKTSLASAYGLMSETSPAFTLPVSPLLSTLLLDINSDLSKFLEDQTVHGFLPVPGRRHRRYYGTSTSSFPGPYTVPPGVTSITMEKASEVKKRSVSLSASQVSSMETCALLYFVRSPFTYGFKVTGVYLDFLSRHSVIAFILSYSTKCSAIIRFLLNLGGGGELSLRFIIFLLHGLYGVFR